MKSIASWVGGLFILIGIVGVSSPGDLVAVGYHLLTPIGLYAVAALRIGIGFVLVSAAPASRAPTALRILGGMIVVAGVATVFLGVERARAILDWWTAQGSFVTRLPYCIAMLIGAFVIYAVRGVRRAE